MFNKMSCKATCILLIILWFTYITYGCFCVTKHPQNIFCKENVVVFVGKVTKEELPKTTQNRYIRYYFKLVTSLKGIRESVGSTIIAQTPSGTSCDMRLTVGEKILLSGTREKTGKIHIGSCSHFFLKTASITFEQMVYFFSSGPDSYTQNCDCKTIVESWSKPDTRKGCNLNTNVGKSCNYHGTGLCKRKGGTCSWENVECKKH